VGRQKIIPDRTCAVKCCMSNGGLPEDGENVGAAMKHCCASRNEIKVTVGLCVKNEEEAIKKTIKSIVEQDFPSGLTELIIIDDGSDDGTLSSILSVVPQINMRVTVFHGMWRGIGAARNTVAQNAIGGYIVWIDGGMTIPRNHVNKQVDFMEKNRDAGIAKAKCGVIREENLISTLESMQYTAFDYRYDGRVESFVVGVGGSAYRVGALKEVGGFDSCIRRSGEDLDIEGRMRDAGWSVYRTSALFYKKHNKTLRSAWSDGVKYGYGGYYLISKHKGTVQNRSIATLLDGLLNAKMVYSLTGKRLAFMLIPLHYLKRIAWFWGFLQAHLERNEPNTRLSSNSTREPSIVFSNRT
jgi:glycosyltransferase involved in cell wall biosynthesis